MARGIFQMALFGPERISGLAIVPEVPVMFTRVMFAPKILATVQELADNFQEVIGKLLLVAFFASVSLAGREITDGIAHEITYGLTERDE